MNYFFRKFGFELELISRIYGKIFEVYIFFGKIIIMLMYYLVVVFYKLLLREELRKEDRKSVV